MGHACNCCLVLYMLVQVDSKTPSVFKWCGLMSSHTGLLNLYTSAAEIPEGPVVETTSPSIAALPAVAISPQLFEPTGSECAAFATFGDVVRWASRLD